MNTLDLTAPTTTTKRFLHPDIQHALSLADDAPITDDHDYFRRRCAVVAAKLCGAPMRHSVRLRAMSFNYNDIPSFGTFAAAKKSDAADARGNDNVSDSDNDNDKKKHSERFYTGLDLADAFDALAEHLEAKITKQLAASKFIPTMERFITKIGAPEDENKIARFIFVYQCKMWDGDIPNFTMWRDGMAQIMREHRGGFGPQVCITFRQLSLLFPEMSMVRLLEMTKQNRVWVKERALPPASNPDETINCGNESFVLVISGLSLTGTQYHAIESPLLQAALADDPAFLHTDAGRAHAMMKNAGGADGGGADGLGAIVLSGNPLQDALAKRDKKANESIFTAMNLVMQEQQQQQLSRQPSSAEHQRADSARMDGDDDDNDGLAGAGATFSTGSMMDRCDSAVDIPGVVEDKSAFASPSEQAAAVASATDDDARMKLPYSDDLDYLTDQFKLLGREKAVVRLTRALNETNAANAGEEEEDDNDMHGFGGRRRAMRGQARDQARAEGELRKAQSRLKVQAEVCRARLTATAAAGSWYPRLEILCQALALKKFEKLVLLELIKTIIDPVCADDAPPWAKKASSARSVRDLQDLFCANLQERMATQQSFYKKASLIGDGIIYVTEGSEFLTSVAEMVVDIDRRMLDFVVGADSEMSEIVEGSHLYTPSVQLEDVILPDVDKARIVEAVENFEAVQKKKKELKVEEHLHHGSEGMTIMLYGPPGTGKTLLAEAIATKCNRKLLLINFPNIGHQTGVSFLMKMLFRESKVRRALLFIDECEALLRDREKSGSFVVNELLPEIERHNGLIIMATNRPQDIDVAVSRRCHIKLKISEPDHHLRERIWKKLHPPLLKLAPDVSFPALSLRFDLTGALIKNAYLGAIGLMVTKKADVVTQADLVQAAHEQIMGRLSMNEFEHKLTPIAGLESLVVTDALLSSLRDIVLHAKAQDVLFSTWGFGKQHRTSRSAVALFAGASGCGKTLAASAIGFELGRPLKVINVAQLVSKWVGETGKNIASVFKEATADDAILVFDECESLLGKRGGDGSTSRHDNMNVGLLLQLVESFDGVCIFITNLKEHVDPAFFRRIQYVLEFERPTAALRKRLWPTIIPAQCPVAPDVNYGALSDRYDLSGGQIKSAALRAATRAALRNTEAERRLTMADFERACKEELEKADGKVGGNGAAASMYV